MIKSHFEEFKKNERHIRWNWEVSPENLELVRYHFIVVDDKNRDGKMNKILESFNLAGILNFPFEEIRSIEDKFFGTKFRYLFKTYDTYFNPQLVKFGTRNVKQDYNLKERIRGNIEDYVANLYFKK